MGAVVTVELPEDAPEHSQPWIITFGPIEDDESWEPVVCGPYERAHALSLAETVVADEELLAVVEPVKPFATVDQIRAEIELSKAAAAAAEDEDDEDSDLDIDLEHDHEDEFEEVEPTPPPSAEEVRAGFARIASRLANVG
jgi:hypothetical protein